MGCLQSWHSPPGSRRVSTHARRDKGLCDGEEFTPALLACRQRMLCSASGRGNGPTPQPGSKTRRARLAGERQARRARPGVRCLSHLPGNQQGQTAPGPRTWQLSPIHEQSSLPPLPPVGHSAACPRARAWGPGACVPGAPWAGSPQSAWCRGADAPGHGWACAACSAWRSVGWGP